jgi:hypothetical protein
MKEGYLQTKIAELNDKCKKIDQMISMEKSKILLLNEQVGGFKELLKKLKDIERIKEDTVNHINKENEKLIQNQIEKLSNKTIKIIETLIQQKTKNIDETLNYLLDRKDEINQQTEMITQQTKEINFLIEHNNLFMMKLANKGILTQREIDEMDRRSIKKAKMELKKY